MNILSSKHGINVAVLGQIGPLHVQDTTGQHGGRGYFPSLGGFFSGRWYCDIGEGMHNSLRPQIGAEYMDEIENFG